MPKILLIGDSFGCARIHDGIVSVPNEKTWPELVKKYFSKLNEISVDSDFLAFRFLYEILESLFLTLESNTYELVIIEAGLVDCFPRPLPKRLFRSRIFIFRIIRKMISYIRKFWLKHVYCKPMISYEELVDKFVSLVNKFPNINFQYITITPQIHQAAIQTPDQSTIIKNYNKAIQLACSNYHNFSVFDFHKVCCQDYLHPLDSHLSILGNKYLANIVIKKINQYIKSDIKGHRLNEHIN